MFWKCTAADGTPMMVIDETITCSILQKFLQMMLYLYHDVVKQWFECKNLCMD